ncbi:MAG: ATP-binding protein [Planctomycetes bacterium]|nr:ATP-binding protein [Planctomycetota bacterium]
MSHRTDDRRRALLASATEALADFPAAILVGARQTGKSTLAAQLVDAGTLRANVTLDDDIALAAASNDPQAFVSGLEHGTAIDEVQRAPDLLRAAKRVIDRDRRPGRFLITGSANILSLPKTTESLAGRAALLQLEGFSLAELEERAAPTDLPDLLLGTVPWPRVIEQLRTLCSPLPPEAQQQTIFFGGFPEVALRQSTRFHDSWFRAYTTMYVERDARQLARIPDTVAFTTVFRLIASASGQLANMTQLGIDARIDQRTAAAYVRLLELTFQVDRLEPWFANVRKRLVKTPRLYLRDSGHLCHLLGIDSPGAIARHPARNALYETWIYGELRKLLGLGGRAELTFFRMHPQGEIDFLLQRGTALAAIDVCARTSVTADEFAGIQALRNLLGPRVRGIVLYGGDEVVAFGDGLAAVPFGVLGGVRPGSSRRRQRATQLKS